MFWVTEPIPGTELWRQAGRYGSFDTSGRFTNLIVSGSTRVWVPDGWDREELEALAASATLRFYRRPKAIWQAAKTLFHVPFRRWPAYVAAALLLCLRLARQKGRTRAVWRSR